MALTPGSASQALCGHKQEILSRHSAFTSPALGATCYGNLGFSF